MKATLVSFFDSENIGDLLISQLLMEKAKEYTDVKPIDFSGSEKIKNGITIKRGSNDAPTGNSRFSIKNLIIRSQLDKLWLPFIVKKTEIILPDYEKKIQESDVLIIGGGNMVFDLHPWSLSSHRFEYFVNIAKKYNKPVFATSLGIGPFETNYQKKKAVKALSKCDYITFRDNESLNLFKSINKIKKAYVTPDPVFFLEKKISQHEVKDSILLNVINPNLFPNNMNYKEVIKNYQSLIKGLLKSSSEKIVIFNTESKDFGSCEEVYSEFINDNRVFLSEIKSSDELLKIYNSAKLLIGTRMHSLITGYSQNIPIIGLSWQQKVIAMFDLIEEEHSVVDLSDLSKKQEYVISITLEKIQDNNHQKHNRVLKKLKKLESKNDEIFKEIFAR